MIPYIFLNFSIIFSDYFKDKIKFKRILYIFVILLMFFLQALRGDFTSDYKSYINRFNYYNFSFSENGVFFLLDVKDPLDALIHVILGRLSTNPIVIHLFYATITFIVLYYFINKYYKKIDVFLLLFLFVNVGFYFQGFNVSRQVFATVLIMLVYDNLEEINLKYFIIYILIISLIHFSSIIFLFIGIALKIFLKKNLYNSKIVYISIVIILFLTIIDRTNLFNFILGTNFYFDGYNLNNVVVPTSLWIFINIFSWFYNYKIDLKYKYFLDLYILFCYLGLLFSLAVRFSFVFNFFSILLISKLLNDKKFHYIKTIVYFLGCLYTYVILSGTGYDPYYFIF